jgi:hypothetical protein
LQNILFTAFEQLLATRIEGAIASGTYDVGLETLTADSLAVTDRRTIYTHPGTSAETRLLTIARRERNKPVTLAEAIACLADGNAVPLVNSQSGRAAVQVPAPSLMLDDGEVERRVRLIRPMERPTLPLAAMPETHWRDADRDSFARAWADEVAKVPEFTTSEIHIVTGLLLPIWNRFPNDSTRVYRLQTDAGERLVGRRVSPEWVAASIEAEPPSLSPDAAFATLADGRAILELTGEMQLRRVRIMGEHRIELTGFTDAMRDRLRAWGLFSEIIAWKLRFFVPIAADGAVGETGEAVLARLIERYPLVRVCAHAAD